MAVYNGAATLPATLAGILAQTERDIELLVVDDGSTDATSSILAACDDPRLRVLTQTNEGLTRALIRGCREARAPILARHDDGDISMPERFAKQLAALRDDVVLVSCWARQIGPEGEPLNELRADGDDVRRSLLHDPVTSIRGLPHHGTAMFRRADYEAAGGYRDAFRFAQDLDLWVRLAARGNIAIVPEVLYETRFEPGAISASRRNEQIALATIALQLRDGGASSLLDEARKIGATKTPKRRGDRSRALYFIASCLRRNGDVRYKRYARAALRSNPLNARAWLLFLRR
ncbi:MAG TPA: glycosyltransferase family A protein [Thermoanaerobaculia bacterium]|nr:glycosyltransferase family A protein [Thermoanaerobaculia bacterium]